MSNNTNTISDIYEQSKQVASLEAKYQWAKGNLNSKEQLRLLEGLTDAIGKLDGSTAITELMDVETRPQVDATYGQLVWAWNGNVDSPAYLGRAQGKGRVWFIKSQWTATDPKFTFSLSLEPVYV